MKDDSTEPLSKEAFEQFFGSCPSTAPVTTKANLMMDFNLTAFSMDWIDEFEGVEFLMKDDRTETRSAGQAPTRNVRTESMDERLNRFMMDFCMDDDPLDMAMDDLNVVAQPKQRH
eukprot:760159-Hanusia_phi.AAC.1